MGREGGNGEGGVGWGRVKRIDYNIITFMDV